MDYSITRQQIVDAALSLRTTPFRHQGRDAVTGCDCVGLLVLVGQLLDYPHIYDVEGYRRVPSADVIRQTLQANMDEIPVEEVGLGDVYLMRIGGRKPRHAAIVISTETDIEGGLEPQLIHARGLGDGGAVVVEPIRQWQTKIVAGFRLRGLKV